MLKDGIARIWGMKELIVIPVVVDPLGAISTGFEKYIAAIVIDMRIEQAQKTGLLGTARILKLVLGCSKKHHYRHYCARLCETFDNGFLSALTRSAGTTNNNTLSIIIDDNNSNNNNINNNNSYYYYYYCYYYNNNNNYYYYYYYPRPRNTGLMSSGA